jgi:hypothetical protein
MNIEARLKRLEERTGINGLPDIPEYIHVRLVPVNEGDGTERDADTWKIYPDRTEKYINDILIETQTHGGTR